MCEACENDQHEHCGMQTWCECDCPGPDGSYEDWGCCFPGKCLMPDFHFPSECHTVEMMQALEAEFTVEDRNDGEGQ